MGRTVVKDDGARGPGELLDELDRLWIVLLLDSLIVLERLVLCGAAEILETGGVEGDGMLLASDVLNLRLVLDAGPILLAPTGRRIGVDVGIGC